MRTLRAILEKITTPAFRRWLSYALKSIEGGLMRIPWLGKVLWRQKFLELYERPHKLAIEITSICNAKCIMCPRQNMDRRMEVMNFDLFRSIITQAADMGITTFVLNGYGEIFTAKKHYKDFINFVFEKVPRAKIIINTNGSLMKEEEAQFLIDKGIDTVHIDIDGATAETFEKVRENLKFRDVVNNTRRLIELRKAQGKTKPKVRVGMIKQKENHHEAQAHYDMWKDVADYTASDYMVSRLGSVEKFHQERIVGYPCSLPFYELNVMSDGNAVMCCDDWNSELPMGNVKTMGLKEVWQGERFKRVRALHQAGRQAELSTCAKCDFARPGDAWFQIHREVIEEDLQLIPQTTP